MAHVGQEETFRVVGGLGLRLRNRQFCGATLDQFLEVIAVQFQLEFRTPRLGDVTDCRDVQPFIAKHDDAVPDFHGEAAAIPATMVTLQRGRGSRLDSSPHCLRFGQAGILLEVDDVHGQQFVA